MNYIPSLVYYCSRCAFLIAIRGVDTSQAKKFFKRPRAYGNAARGRVMKKVRVLISYSWLCISTNRPCLSD